MWFIFGNLMQSTFRAWLSVDDGERRESTQSGNVHNNQSRAHSAHTRIHSQQISAIPKGLGITKMAKHIYHLCIYKYIENFSLWNVTAYSLISNVIHDEIIYRMKQFWMPILSILLMYSVLIAPVDISVCIDFWSNVSTYFQFLIVRFCVCQ